MAVTVAYSVAFIIEFDDYDIHETQDLDNHLQIAAPLVAGARVRSKTSKIHNQGSDCT